MPPGLAFRAAPDGTASIAGKPAPGNKGKNDIIIAITASNGIGRAAAENITIRIQ